jgi:hypothetical protein
MRSGAQTKRKMPLKYFGQGLVRQTPLTGCGEASHDDEAMKKRSDNSNRED